MIQRTIRRLFGYSLAETRVIVKEELESHRTSIERDLAHALQIKARDETAEYITLKMSDVDSVDSTSAVMISALDAVSIDGLYMEFGVYEGSSINRIASRIEGLVYGFDSFCGLPERWRDGFAEGTFKVKQLPEVQENVVLVQGLFEDSLPAFIAEFPDPISFIHIDCDLYSSTKTIFEILGSRLLPGTVIVFDEYFNYPKWQLGEYKAFKEFMEDTHYSYRYICYNSCHEQVAVIITDP